MSNAPTKYCQECGAEIKQEAVLCPECGTRFETSTETSGGDQAGSQTVDLLLGIGGFVSGGIGVVILPILFAPISVVCGVGLVIRGQTGWGIGVILWGLLTGFLGVVLGLLSFLVFAGSS